MIECRVVDIPLEVAQVIARVEDDRAGAIASFIGTVRNSSSIHNVEVLALEYEAYIPMAERELQAIAVEAVERFKAINIIVHHRVGHLAITEPAVAIAVASPHRASAFDACRYIIEELKKRVPIWKKEVFVDGAEWVNAHP